jgi:hypothetical protein
MNEIKETTTLKAEGAAAGKTAPIVDLRCCCCDSATRGRQWWNRDTGYGLCDDCIEYCRVADVKHGDTARAYGIRGFHWDIEKRSALDTKYNGFNDAMAAWDNGHEPYPSILQSAEAARRIIPVDEDSHDTDDDTRTVGLSSDESEEDDNDGGSLGEPETDAERNT